LQIGDESPDICLCSLSSPPPHIYVNMCMYVYVHISLFLPECACTTIIDISPRIFSLMYCCVSIIIVICICPPGPLIWLINLFLFLFHTHEKWTLSHSCEPSGGGIFLSILRVPSVNFQDLPPVKKIKYQKILTYILRSIFLEIPHLELLR
jgi:hypothetical protein